MVNTDDQGFVTNKGRYVDRITAMKIAKQAGQLKNDTRLQELFSEDLW